MSALVAWFRRRNLRHPDRLRRRAARAQAKQRHRKQERA